MDKRARKRVEKPVGKVTAILGRPRELDVMIGMLEGYREETKGGGRIALDYALRRLGERRRAVTGDCIAVADALSEPDFETRLAALFESCAPAKTCYQQTMTRSLRKKHKELHSHYEAWHESADGDDLHAVRVAFKKFRYACELYTAEFAGEMEPFLKQLKQIQQVLGDWHDCRVLRKELEDLAADAPPLSAHHLPGIAEAFERQGAQRLQRFAKLAHAFFAKAHRKEVRRFLKSPKQTCCNGGD